MTIRITKIQANVRYCLNNSSIMNTTWYDRSRLPDEAGSQFPGLRTRGIAYVLLFLILSGVPALAQRWRGPRVPRFTRHSGVVRLHSWKKGFLFNSWVKVHQKVAHLGVGDWIELSGSGAQGDVVFPDLTTILMRYSAEIQIYRIGGKEHEIAIMEGRRLDITLRETPTTLHLPAGKALRGQDAVLYIRFERHFGRIQVRHARGKPVQVIKRGQVVRTLKSGQSLEFELSRGNENQGLEQEDTGRQVFHVKDRRIEIPPGILYTVERRKLFFRRDPILGPKFGVIRIDDEVLVVGPGSKIEVTLH